MNSRFAGMSEEARVLGSTSTVPAISRVRDNLGTAAESSISPPATLAVTRVVPVPLCVPPLQVKSSVVSSSPDPASVPLETSRLFVVAAGVNVLNSTVPPLTTLVAAA